MLLEPKSLVSHYWDSIVYNMYICIYHSFVVKLRTKAKGLGFALIITPKFCSPFLL
jgi:hypothetical protein